MYFSLFVSGVAVAHEISTDHQGLIEPIFTYGKLEFFCVPEAHFFLCGHLPPPAGFRNDPGHCQILVRLDRDPYFWGVDRIPLSERTSHATHISQHEYMLAPYLRRHSPPITGYRAICAAIDTAPRSGKKSEKISNGPFSISKHFDTFIEQVVRENRAADLAERFKNREAISGTELETLFTYHDLWNGLQAKTKSWMRKFLTGASIDGSFKSLGAPLTGLRLEAFDKALKKLIERVGPAGDPAAPGNLELCRCCTLLKADTRLVRGDAVCSDCLAKHYFRCTDCEQYHPVARRELVEGWVGIELCPACKRFGMGKNIS